VSTDIQLQMQHLMFRERKVGFAVAFENSLLFV